MTNLFCRYSLLGNQYMIQQRDEPYMIDLPLLTHIANLCA